MTVLRSGGYDSQGVSHFTLRIARLQQSRRVASFIVGIWIAVLLAFTSVQGYGQAPEIDWHTIDGGGGTLSGGNITLNSTIGQSDAGTMTGGQYHLEGGFWALPLTTPQLTPTPTSTSTRTPTRTPTRTATIASTRTPTRTATLLPTSTRTHTPSRTSTSLPSTLTPTRTPSRTPTVISTLTRTPTLSGTRTATPSRTITPTRSLTPTCAANYDLHADGVIDAQDLLLMTDYLKQKDSRGDMNCDGIIDSMDLWHLSEYWHEEQ